VEVVAPAPVPVPVLVVVLPVLVVLLVVVEFEPPLLPLPERLPARLPERVVVPDRMLLLGSERLVVALRLWARLGV